MSEAERARKLRRRHMHERQAVIFGVLLAFLALAFVVAAAVYTGNLQLPWASRDFTSKPTPTVTRSTAVCPPTGALPVAAGSITVNVYNGDTRSGLARTTGDALAERGFVVQAETNSIAPYTGTVRINFGVQGIAQAYTLAAYVDGAEMQIDTRQDATVDITLGNEFLAIKAADKVTLDPAVPLVGPAGCLPYDEFVASAPPPTAPVAGSTTTPAG